MQTINSDFIFDIFKGCFQSKDFLGIVIDNIKVTYIPEGTLEAIFNELVFQHKTREIRPSIGTMKLAMRKNKDALEMLEEIKEMEPVDIDSILNGLEDFIKNCMFIENYNKASELFNKDKTKEAYTIYSTGAEDISNFTLDTEQYAAVFGDFAKRQVERLNGGNVTKMPSYIDELDRRTNGGHETGQLVIFVAESKGGKSFALSHYGISTLRSGYDVLHIQLEGTKKECLDRYDANWSGNLYQDVKVGEFSDKSLKAYKKIRETMNSEIFVYAPEKFNSFNADNLERRIINMKKKRPNLKLVVVDYLELMAPDNQTYKPSDERFKQQKTARRMKEIAMEQDVLIVTATQTGVLSRELINDPEFVLDREHLGEEKGKIRVVDMMISINRTKDEEHESIARLHIVAAREVWGGNEPIYIKTNLKRSRFYDRKGTLTKFFEQDMLS